MPYLHELPRTVCFSVPEKIQALPSIEVRQWFKEYNYHQFDYKNDQQAESLTRILPLLACGEQSAICVFENEVSRINHNGYVKASSDLQQVVNDEYFHDKLLQNVLGKLPRLNDLNKIKAKAKLFYTRIGHTHSLQAHFLLISRLDACVCRLLNMMEKSNLGKHHPITYLCNIIKKDEARHVGISRRYARTLPQSEHFNNIEVDLMNLLKTEEYSFERLGIDLDKLAQQYMNQKLLEVA